MSTVSIIGIGMIPFRKYPERTLIDIAAEATYNAIKDAAIDQSKIDAAFFANGMAGILFNDVTIGQNVFCEVGINKIPVINVENACTSGSTALYLSYNTIVSGQADIAIAVGAEKMCVPQLGLINSGQTEFDAQLGMVTPATFAIRALRYMNDFGTTAEQLAKVAVKNRKHAANNNFARFKQSITLEDVLNSPMIADPLTRLQCCSIADGAAATILCSSKVAKQFSRSINLNSIVLCTGSYENPQDMIRWETDYRGCMQAYEKAGIGAEDLDLIECHDAFTISEILHYEALGLCEYGEGGRLIEEGHTFLGSRIPVNVSGGLLSKGHPIGATGLAQVNELVIQLRREAGSRQVKNANAALSHCMGGDKAGDTKSCTVAILSS